MLAYAADPKTGMTLTGICKAWNARGIKSPRGKEWSIQSLRGRCFRPGSPDASRTRARTSVPHSGRRSSTWTCGGP
ncbi:recombinase family protein [Streptomyces sp. AD2-2]|nr:recombinase family protein [Streptomyces sp. AD2-2]